MIDLLLAPDVVLIWFLIVCLIVVVLTYSDHHK